MPMTLLGDFRWRFFYWMNRFYVFLHADLLYLANKLLLRTSLAPYRSMNSGHWTLALTFLVLSLSSWTYWMLDKFCPNNFACRLLLPLSQQRTCPYQDSSRYTGGRVAGAVSAAWSTLFCWLDWMTKIDWLSFLFSQFILIIIKQKHWLVD